MTYDPAALAAELDDLHRWTTTIHPTTRPPATSDNTSRGIPGPRLPGSTEILDARHDLHTLLTEWTRVAVEDQLRESDTWPPNSIPGMLVWHSMRIHLWTGHQAADDYATEIHHEWRQWRYLAGEQPPRPLHCIQPGCRGLIDGINSNGHVTEVREQWRWCKCGDCGMTYTFDAAIARLAALQHITLTQWAAEHDTPRRTLVDALRQLGITPEGRRGNAALYLVDDLRRAQTLIGTQTSRTRATLAMSSGTALPPQGGAGISPGDTKRAARSHIRTIHRTPKGGAA